MIKARRFELGTATVNPVSPATWSRQSRQRHVKRNRYSLLRIFLALCCITGAYCDLYEWKKRLPRGLKDLQLAMSANTQTRTPFGRCDFDKVCNWSWKTFSRLIDVDKIKPDENKSSDRGGFLLFRGLGRSTLISDNIPRTGSHCRLFLKLHQMEMKSGEFNFVIQTKNQSYVATGRSGNNKAKWEETFFNIGAITQHFRLLLEISMPNMNSSVAVDDIRLVDCFPESPPVVTVCTDDMFRCNNGSCLNRTRICDLTKDCADGEDELLDCDKMPPHSRCNFEDGWCGWSNLLGHSYNWTLHRGPTPTERSGPSYDHTYRNVTGTYAYVNTAKGKYGYRGVLESPLFNPTPPYSNDPNSSFHQSCQVRFFYHHYGVQGGVLALYLVEVKPHQNNTKSLWWSYGDKSDDWYSQATALPEIRYKYFLQFEASKGYSSKGDIAIDDISLSPECFGLGVPAEVVGNFDYYKPVIDFETTPEPHVDFINKTVIHVTTCGATGRIGPTTEQCMEKHNETNVKMVVLPSKYYQNNLRLVNLTGIQTWTAPSGGYYTLIGIGARGGRGSADTGSSLGALVRGVVELEKGDQLYFMVGQPGTDACPKNLGVQTKKCENPYDKVSETGGMASIMEKVKKMEIKDGGGGGGGATYIFTLKNNDEHEPLLIAAGGGGLGLRVGQTADDGIQHGKGLSPYENNPRSGQAITENAGPGGGWNNTSSTSRVAAGIPLIRGGFGGAGCGSGKGGYGNGGFGGGGGGCLTGGGGGGYIGGSTGLKDSGNGEGGYSYVAPALFHVYLEPAVNSGPGEVYIIPAISNCGCDFRCVALDRYLSETKCLCPPGWILGNNSKSCNMANDSNVSHQAFMILIIVFATILLLVFTGVCLMLYNRYQNRKALLQRRQVMFGNNGTELTALGAVSDSMMTEYNPNYEFAGNIYNLYDLPQIPREHISLVKPLGQGAFGEVFQGVYKYRGNEECPVAVKTLPSLTTSQAESDFVMEALIMSKFSHPNIVKFIGVSFNKHPRYIVLELLAGGDLKNFLREERPRPDRPTTLTMTDLLMCAYNVANGCKFMEESHFIHRDIAARNCLLTCKGSGRIVKIADFGMARDIYRSDYYRKGGKAMLPVKWMPPESFLDGIFTTKTDVWAFGVLLWEIMSFGYMPYTGCANREVMSRVKTGGRLEKPAGCPDPIYGIMTRCWHSHPESRPGFATIIERINYCLQDPDVINHPTPNYDILPACDREITVMRPDPETECINVMHSDFAFMDGYLQPRDSEFRSVTYRIEQAYKQQKKLENESTNDNISHTRDTQEPGPSNSYEDNLKNINNENNLVNARTVLDNDTNDRTEKERNKMTMINDERNDSLERSDNGNEDPLEDQDDFFSENSDGTDLAADRKNGNESTTTTDTNSDSMAVVPADTSTDTTSNSTPNTCTCSPSRIVLNANVNNANGILKKSALKAALSLDPSALYRGAMHYEKIPFSAPPQRSSTPGSIELTKDSLGHELPRQEECSC